jgi:hypothetical protein
VSLSLELCNYPLYFLFHIVSDWFSWTNEKIGTWCFHNVFELLEGSHLWGGANYAGDILFCCSLFSLVSNCVPWASLTKEKISTTQEFFHVKCAALSFLQSEIIGISCSSYAIYWHVANVWYSGEETTNLSHQGLVSLSGSLLPWLSSITCRW